MAGQYLIFIIIQTYVAPVLRKIPFPCLPPMSGGKTGIFHNTGATQVCKEIKITGLPYKWRNIPF